MQDPRARGRARRGAVRRRRRSSGSSTRACRARRSRASTGRTRSRACSRTCWCGARSATRSSAARSSTSAPRSRTRSRTCRCSSTRATAQRSPGSRTRRSAGSARRRSRGCSATRDTMGIPVWDAAAEPSAVPGLGTAAIRALDRFMDTMARPAGARRGRSPVGDLLEAVLHESGYLEALEAERTIEAQGRIENLEELVEVAREFDRPSRPRTTPTPRWRRSSSRSRWSPTPTAAWTTRASSRS